MFHVGQAVGLPHGRHGVVNRLVTAREGRRIWLVEWGDRTTGHYEDELIDVEAAEWADCEAGVPVLEQCPSVLGVRRCWMRRGHHTKRHRAAEVSWTDAMATPCG